MAEQRFINDFSKVFSLPLQLAEQQRLQALAKEENGLNSPQFTFAQLTSKHPAGGEGAEPEQTNYDSSYPEFIQHVASDSSEETSPLKEEDSQARLVSQSRVVSITPSGLLDEEAIRERLRSQIMQLKAEEGDYPGVTGVHQAGDPPKLQKFYNPLRQSQEAALSQSSAQKGIGTGGSSSKQSSRVSSKLSNVHQTVCVNSFMRSLAQSSSKEHSEQKPSDQPEIGGERGFFSGAGYSAMEEDSLTLQKIIDDQSQQIIQKTEQIIELEKENRRIRQEMVARSREVEELQIEIEMTKVQVERLALLPCPKCKNMRPLTLQAKTIEFQLNLKQLTAKADLLTSIESSKLKRLVRESSADSRAAKESRALLAQTSSKITQIESMVMAHLKKKERPSSAREPAKGGRAPKPSKPPTSMRAVPKNGEKVALHRPPLSHRQQAQPEEEIKMFQAQVSPGIPMKKASICPNKQQAPPMLPAKPPTLVSTLQPTLLPGPPLSLPPGLEAYPQSYQQISPQTLPGTFQQPLQPSQLVLHHPHYQAQQIGSRGISQGGDKPTPAFTEKVSQPSSPSYEQVNLQNLSSATTDPPQNILSALLKQSFIRHSLRDGSTDSKQSRFIKKKPAAVARPEVANLNSDLKPILRGTRNGLRKMNSQF